MHTLTAQDTAQDTRSQPPHHNNMTLPATLALLSQKLALLSQEPLLSPKNMALLSQIMALLSQLALLPHIPLALLSQVLTPPSMALLSQGDHEISTRSPTMTLRPTDATCTSRTATSTTAGRMHGSDQSGMWSPRPKTSSSEQLKRYASMIDNNMQ